jgi:drug/metabolite transporter (DMT)-like permease
MHVNANTEIGQMRTDKAWFSWMMAFLATAALSTTAPVGRAAILAGMNPTALLAARYTIAAILLSATLRFTTHPQANSRRNQIDLRGLLLCSAAGVASGAATLSYFWSFSRINASISAMLVSLYPLIVLVLLALRGERFTLLNSLRLGLGAGGVYLLLGPGGVVDAWGVILALISALSFATQLVIIQWYLSVYPSRLVTYYVVSITALLVAGLWLVSGAEWRVLGWQVWLAIIFLAVVSTYLSRLAMFSAIQALGSGQVALLSPLETFLAVVWSIAFLRESLSPFQWIGGILILASAMLILAHKNRTILHA